MTLNPVLRRLAGQLSLGLATALCLATSAAADPARVIVHFRTAAQPQTLATAASAGSGSSATSLERRTRRASWLGARQGMTLQEGRVIDAHRQVVIGGGEMGAEQLAAKLRQDPAVAWAVPDRRRHAAAYPATDPDDPLFPMSGRNDVVAGQWYLRAPTSTFVSAINAQAAWTRATGRGVVVADIDTGVLRDHPDLQGKLVGGYDFVSHETQNRDGDGVDDNPADPGDWSTYGECYSNAKAQSSSWHGTQTSSIIAASTNNGVGMAGVAPDARILPLRVLADCGGWDSDIIAAMLWAAGLPVGETQAVNAYPARVLNLSLGSSDDLTCPQSYVGPIADINAMGVVIVAAAGNDEGLHVNSPANCSGVIAVSGLRHTGTKVGYSNVGPEVALAAPAGNCVNETGPCLYTVITARSSSKQGPAAGVYGYSNTSNYAIGTSFATPMVAAAAAMMLEVNPSLTPAQVKSLLQSSARAFPTAVTGVAACHAPNDDYQDECLCTSTTCGAGMLDVARALAAAEATAVPAVVFTPSALAVSVGRELTISGADSGVTTGRAIASYAWSVAGGNATISGSSTGATVTLTGVSEGFAALTLTVVDNLGAQASRTAWVAVNAATTPVARIVLPSDSVIAGASLTADGSSSVVASDTVNHRWQVLQGGGLAGFSGSTTSATALLQTVAQQTGDVSLALTVDDGQGHSASQVVTFAVVAEHPSASLMVASRNMQVGQTLNLDASLSTATDGRTITGYTWWVVSGQEVAQLGVVTTQATAALTAVRAGTVRVAVRVTDSAGATDTRMVDIEVSSNSTASVVSGQGGGGGAADEGALLGLGLLLGLAAWGARRRMR
ncbi:MAG: hypothetical protein RI907_349 [Pseudomonadota bacterium]|jgi:serine protease